MNVNDPANAVTTHEVARTISRVYDPELGIDIVALGLIYGIEADPERVHVTMTMTSRGCPMGAAILEAVDQVLQGRFPEAAIDIDLSWDPPYDVAMADDRAREWLGLPPLRATA